MIDFVEKKDISGESNLIRIFFDFSCVEVAPSDLAQKLMLRINDVISNHFDHKKITVDATSFLNDFFYFKCVDFPSFFFVECENATGKAEGEIIITSKNLNIIWALGERKIIHHISHFIKAVLSDFPDYLKFREVVVESVKTSFNEYRGLNDTSFDDKINSAFLSTKSKELMSNLFDDLSLGKKRLLGRDIYPLFGEGRPRKDIFPELIDCCLECMKHFDVFVSCVYYDGDDEDGEEIDFENLIEHVSKGEGVYSVEHGELIENFDFNKLGLSINKND